MKEDNDNRKKILVVDDEEDLCEILRFNLENEGYGVNTALSAEEAVATSPLLSAPSRKEVCGPQTPVCRLSE